MENSPTVLWRILLLLIASAWLAGCDRNDVRVYEAPKEDTSTAGHGIVDGPPALPGPIAGDTSSKPQWLLPAGWKQIPSTEAMRYATLLVDPADPALQVTVSSAMGDLLANVNRWEGQVGAPISTQADLGNVVTHVTNNSLDIDLVDLTGSASGNSEPKRMLAAIIYQRDANWFVKLMGPASKVSAHKDEFGAFVQSISFSPDAAHTEAAANEPAGGPTQVDLQPGSGGAALAVSGEIALKSWQAPAGWTLDSQARPMRLMTFHIQGDGQMADVIVSAFANDEFGDRVANINMWRSGVGLPPISDAGAAATETVPAGDTQAVVFDFAGLASDGHPAQRVIVAQVEQGKQTFFFKLIGGDKLVAEEKPALEAFLKSLQFARAE